MLRHRASQRQLAASNATINDEQKKSYGYKSIIITRGTALLIIATTFCVLILFSEKSSPDNGLLVDESSTDKRIDDRMQMNKVNSNRLWRGEAIILRNQGEDYDRQDKSTHVAAQRASTTIELVIAYCRNDLNWIYKDVLGEISADRSTTVKMTIISKCASENLIPDFEWDKRVDEVNVVSLPDVGGCHLAYAYFMNRYVESHSKEEASSSVILFMKDEPRLEEDTLFLPYQDGYRTVGEMIDIASSGNFICGVKPNCDVSPFHATEILYSFGSEMAELEVEDFNVHGYNNLKDFHTRALNWTFPNQNVTNVCYGSTFGVPGSRLIALSNQRRERKAIEALEEVLSRKSLNVTIEEHFAERTWGGLLSYPLTREQTELIHEISDGKGYVLRRNNIMGAMKSGMKFLTCPPDRLNGDDDANDSQRTVKSSKGAHKFVRMRKTVKRKQEHMSRIYK